MSEALEIQQVVEHLQRVLDNLFARGLGLAGTAEQNALTTLGDEFMRMGAGHLADRIASLREALESNDPAAPNCLLRTQTSLRLFERILTLEVARGSLVHWKQMHAIAGEAADESETD